MRKQSDLAKRLQKVWNKAPLQNIFRKARWFEHVGGDVKPR